MTKPKHFIPISTIAAAAVFASCPSAAAEDILFTNAVVHTVSGPTHSPGFVLVAGDTIKAVGPAEQQPDAGESKVINLKGQQLFPGLIAPTTALGLMEIPAVRATVDTSSRSIPTRNSSRSPAPTASRISFLFHKAARSPGSLD